MGIYDDSGYPRPVLCITNNNRLLLEWSQRTLGGSVVRNNGRYKLQIFREQAIEALRKLPITHEEKATAKELILHYHDNGGIGTEALSAYRELSRKIDEEIRLCTMQARLEFLRRHGKPHRLDPDQTIPEEN